MNRFVCIHGHFYQPPRENPVLETIEIQDGAYPYHDWNERVTAECYAPNSLSRILDRDKFILRLVNNYRSISFDFGPTLLSWLEAQAPAVYVAVLEADRHSREAFGGHGSAMAQAYNHLIMPLANERDRQTQVKWGLADFERRFGRPAEGMWLPETAVDTASLEIMAREGVSFTVLAPHQASQVRPLDATDRDWRPVGPGELDTARTYLCRLPSGRTINLFFYQGALAREVAFDRLLEDGKAFADRLVSAFGQTEEPQLVHLATDGETFGHHHRFGDMALAWALDYITSQGLARLTNYGQYLELFPPQWEVRIAENTSWSCPHGVERWRSDCGCTFGEHPQWKQDWRQPLRRCLDELSAALARGFEAEGGRLFSDPWAAREAYIGLIPVREAAARQKWVTDHLKAGVGPNQTVKALKLLEMQHQAMLMFTSCGWFFEDLAGLETLQIMAHAGRAVQLAGQVLVEDPEADFLAGLAKAKSNRPGRPDGRRLFETKVRPLLAGLERVAANYAIVALFLKDCRIGAHQGRWLERRKLETGRAALLGGRLSVLNQITLEEGVFLTWVLHLGDHNLICGLAPDDGQLDARAVAKEVREPFQRADLTGAFQAITGIFNGRSHALEVLFRDQRRRIIDLITTSTRAEAEDAQRRIYETHGPLLHFLQDLGTPPPRALSAAADLVVNADLRQALAADSLDGELIDRLLDEAGREGLELDAPTLEFAFRRGLERRAERFDADPFNLKSLRDLSTAVELSGRLPFFVNLWQVENVCYRISRLLRTDPAPEAGRTKAPGRAWLTAFQKLAGHLKIRLDP